MIQFDRKLDIMFKLRKNLSFLLFATKFVRVLEFGAFSAQLLEFRELSTDFHNFFFFGKAILF